MSGIFKAVGAGIGLASEAIHHSRAKSKAAKEANGSQSGETTPVQGSTLSPSTSQSASQSVSRSVSQQDEPPVANPYVNNGNYYNYNNRNDTAIAGPSNAPPPPSYLTPEEEKRRLAENEKQALAADADGFNYYDDEAAWELDDMAEYVDPPAYEEAAGETSRREASSVTSPTEERPEDEVELAELQGDAKEEAKKQIRMVRELVRMAGPAPTPMRRIPCPVIIPQRRPRTKARGFVRAYAPVLNDSGISQDVFLKFLKGWYLASKASPWIDVVYVAAGIAGFVPELGAQIASIVVQVVAGTARELQSRHRNNSFLDRANQELFMPRGLFAMVMAFKDDMPDAQSGGLLGGIKSAFGKSVISAERLDINQTTIKYSQLAALGGTSTATMTSKTKNAMRNLRTNNGMTYTELELPQAAELVYPDLDNAAERDLATVEEGGEPKTASKWKRSGKFVSSYLDRRAQAEYEGTHQGSSMAVPSDARKPFMSRYADPNSAANSGSLVALLTGGYIAPDRNRGRGGLLSGVLGGGSEDGRGRGLGGGLGRGFGRSYDYDEYDDRRRRRQGPIGAGIGLIGAGVNMYMQKREQRQAKTSESHITTNDFNNTNNLAGGFFDDRQAQPQMQYAGYESQMQYANSPAAPYGSSNPPAPYGSSNPPAPYGGSSEYPVDRPPPQTQQSYNSNSGSTNNNTTTASYPLNKNLRREQPRGIKKVLQQDVLYLLIVNLPTDEEVQASVAELQRLTSQR
ncbi:hypothetical protein SBRCBS47491_002920 [Sporothrix bragantina]|uniref:Uncharacterized protein n=1 Tax=Sporothrix bragantina TaxID=671064 RepID=A0ABP0BBZ2_9PEZI